MVQIKAKDLQNKNTEELKAQLEGLKQELLTLRVAKVSGKAGPSKLSQLKVVRKNVARVMTVVHSKERKAVAAAYKGKKYAPKDLRNKKTRALRRALTKSESSAKTLRQKKALSLYPTNLRIVVKA